MKKIGIVTFHQALNYGAMLQAYINGHFAHTKAEIVDYRCEKLSGSDLAAEVARLRQRFCSLLKG